MTNNISKTPLTDIERHMINYDRRQYRNRQAQFESKRVLPCSKLGFNDIEDLTISVLIRLSGKRGKGSDHRPNLFDPNYEIGEIRRLCKSCKSLNPIKEGYCSNCWQWAEDLVPYCPEIEAKFRQ